MILDMDTADFEVKFISEQKGRGLFARRHFKTGETLFEEEPLVCCQFSWNTLYKYAACDFCMRPLETTQENVRRLSRQESLVLPYPECCPTDSSTHVQCPHCMVQYCSAKCRDVAWRQYHQTLCMGVVAGSESHPLQRLDEAWRQTHYPPETATIMLLARMIATVRQAEDPEAAMAIFMQFCHHAKADEEQLAHKLLKDQFVTQVDHLRQLLSDALYADCVHQWLTPEGFVSLLALVGTNAQGIASSPLSMWVNEVSDLSLGPEERAHVDTFIDGLYETLHAEVGQFLNVEGSGLYALQSCCNHSCQPNAETVFRHNYNRLTLVALCDILPGEEVSISYLDDCTVARSRHSRHRILRENYLFVCSCVKCEAETADPDVTSEEDSEHSDDSAEH